MAMEIEMISTETIKPSSPTPNHLITFKLSLFDQLTGPVFSKLVYFYLPSDSADGDLEAKSQQLKTSLSEILPRFYPFAGRIKGNFSVDCNDDGAIYVEARVRGCLIDVLKESLADEAVRQFLPLNSQETDSGLPLLLVQTTLFQCGGLAIGLLFCHKIADAATMATLISAWSAAATGGVPPPPVELSTAASLFPPKDFLANLPLPTSSSVKISTKRFVFSSSSIATLKSKSATSTQPKPPTRVESVSALIWKCATKASRSNSAKKNPSILFQGVNLRTRFDPPLPETSTGNIVGYYPVEVSEEDTEMHLNNIVDGLKRGLTEFCDGYVKQLQEKEGSSAILQSMKQFNRGDADMYAVTSWCRFPINEADFGWGKPVWICTAHMPFKNVVVLIDECNDSGVEAYVSLKDEDMAVFERDQDLLAYATPNPAVLKIV